MQVTPSSNWVQYDHLTSTYRTGDGTVVAGELVNNASCLADVLHIAIIRAEQRAAMAADPDDQQTGDASDGCGESPDGSDDD